MLCKTDDVNTNNARYQFSMIGGINDNIKVLSFLDSRNYKFKIVQTSEIHMNAPRTILNAPIL